MLGSMIFSENVNLSVDVRRLDREFKAVLISFAVSFSFLRVDRQYERKDMNEKCRAVSIEMASLVSRRYITSSIDGKCFAILLVPTYRDR